MSSNKFEKALVAYVTSRDETMKLAQEAANLAIEQVFKHGNCTHLTMMAEAMHNKFDQKDAFIKWAVSFANVRLEKKKFKMDADRAKMSPETFNKAIETPYWTFAAPASITSFSADDVRKAVERVLAKYINKTDKYTPEDELARLEVVQLLDTVKSRPSLVNSNISNNAPVAA